MSEKQGNKIIITAAITGSIHTPTMSPYLPIKPTEIADEAVRAWEAGASVAHIHVRDPDTGKPTSSLDLFREVLSEIKARCDIVICVTTGGSPGMTVEERAAPVPEFKPELASLNFGSMNFALHPMASKFKGFKYEWEEPFLSMTENNIFPNTFKTLREFCEIYRANGTKPELEIYDVGMINNAAHMLMQGHLAPPVYIQFVLGILGGIPATLENLMFMYKTARQALGEFTWSVCAAGRHQMRMCTASILMGGNVRVGLEDSLYLEKGKIAKSNAEQVEKILRIAKEFGFSPASPDETREILGLKGLDKVNF
ncbi:MAG TPA: 3-keto-5-aminohexanoate cleavage protein [Desulfobacteraceae bacterium]|nr:3-keto-5-aminohexanoate cleavage protein [Desulfobacteraceae bacterium]